MCSVFFAPVLSELYQPAVYRQREDGGFDVVDEAESEKVRANPFNSQA